MLTPEYLARLFEYNRWANERVLLAAEQLSDFDLKKDQGHSWGSIHAMLVHMLSAEWIWLRRLQGHSPAGLLSAAEFPTVDAVRTRWAVIASNLFAFLHEQTPANLMQDVHYRSTEGNAYTLKTWQILVHVANHATHHRGELAAMFALLDVPHEEDDWLFYFLQTPKGNL